MNRGLALLVLWAFAGQAAAELYRWVDDKGRVNYSNQRPPASAKAVSRSDTKVQVEAVPTGAPVTLYTANCGAACDQARDFLSKRGVPFTLKNAQEDPAAGAELEKLVGAREIPVLLVGKAVQKGFESTLWGKILEAGGHSLKTPKAAGEAKPDGKADAAGGKQP